MTDLVFKKIEWILSEPKDCVYPVFGFAISDYKNLYNLTFKDFADFWIFGAILDSSDDSDDFFVFMDKLRKSESIKVFVFDINYISNDFITKLVQQFEVGGRYEELKDCYEDRVVFVLKK